MQCPSERGLTCLESQFHAPAPYLNTAISVFPTLTVNANHWKADFICSARCSDWWGSSIDPNNKNATFGYAASGRPIARRGNLPNQPDCLPEYDAANGKVKYHFGRKPDTTPALPQRLMLGATGMASPSAA